MVEHICTNSSFDTEHRIQNYKCPYCCKSTTGVIGWLGVRCINCNKIYGDTWIGEIARTRRINLKLTRKQMGKIIGKSKHTIKYYEFVKCSEIYFNKLEKMIKKQSTTNSPTESKEED